MADRRKVQWVAITNTHHIHVYFKRKGTRDTVMAHVTYSGGQYKLVVEDDDIRYTHSKQDMIDLILSLW